MPKRKAEECIEVEVITDPVEAAKAASLHYINEQDTEQGIRRKHVGKHFSYMDESGKAIHDEKILARIKSLVIPPAWTEVWICPSPNGHIQAIGRDAKGRKQYRYHPRWRKVRNETKFTRMMQFAEALPAIRKAVETDLKKTGQPREKVLALVVRLLETTFIRIGNPEYARNNLSFGLTTMRDKHVDVSGSTISFEFRGKSGVEHSIAIHDRRVARLVQQCKDIPGQHLFQYIDDNGQHQSITSTDVNSYLHEIGGAEFTAKDFRTWAGTVLAVRAFQQIGPAQTATEAKKNIVQATKEVSEQLGNTPAVCSKYYIHPTVVEAYKDGSLFEALGNRAKNHGANSYALDFEESAVLTLLRKQVQAAA